MSEEHVFSPSQLDSFAMCRRKYYWSYIKGYIPKGRINWNLLGGTLIHTAFEHYYKTWNVQKAIKAAQAEAQEMTTEHGGLTVDDSYERDKYLRMIEGFIPATEQLFDDKNTYKVVATEAEFDMVRVAGYLFKGIIDLIVADKTGNIFIIDHKSKSRVSGGYLATLPLQNQSIIYPKVASSIAGRDVRRIIYNIVQKPALYQRKTETKQDYIKRIPPAITADPSKYLLRETVRIGAERQDEALKHVAATCKDITKLAKIGKAERYYKCPISCSKFGSACEFLPLCMDGETKPNMNLYDVREDIQK